MFVLVRDNVEREGPWIVGPFATAEQAEAELLRYQDIPEMLLAVKEVATPSPTSLRPEFQQALAAAQRAIADEEPDTAEAVLDALPDSATPEEAQVQATVARLVDRYLSQFPNDY